ncbi:MAG: DNA polymerase domain-containing protein [Candidatus Bathyarchaeota archaeon]
MLQQNPVLDKIKGWLFDVYPSTEGQMNVWVICENGQRIKLVDTFKPRFYVSSKEASANELQSIVSKLPIDSCRFVSKHVDPTNWSKSMVLEVTVTNYQKIPFLVRKILESGKYLRYQIHNSDVAPSQLYLYERSLFPLAFVEINVEKYALSYTLLDSVELVNYTVPPFRFAGLQLTSNTKHKPSTYNEPLDEIAVTFDDGKKVVVDSGTERYKLLHTAYLIRKFDPDIIFTTGGDSFIFPYLAKRAKVNEISNNFVLSRDKTPLIAESKKGTTYMSYGQTYYRSPTRRLYGRIHIDENNTFVFRESGFHGLIEIARSCRVPLHKASRSSIGTTMSSLQNYQALKDGFLIARNKQVGESFKSAYQLLLGDRGGFVYEPKVLDFAVTKRLAYKKLVKQTQDQVLHDVYDKRQSALKWILVTCFGYLGYRNSKFGTVDGHMGVCAFGRDSLLKASCVAETKGFKVIHGIVDSLWLKKETASSEDYIELAEELTEQLDLPLNFSGLYKWIVFVPSKAHPRVPVPNRYYGVKTDGTIKVRGIDTRRRDTPKFVYDAQLDMIRALSCAENSKEFVKKIPEALKVVKAYKKKLLDHEIPIWDLIITKRISKKTNAYSQNVSQRIVGKQLLNEGYEVHPGKNVKYVFTDAQNKKSLYRVKAKELIDEQTSPDTKKYLSLLYSAASNLLDQFGFCSHAISEYASGYQTPKLEILLK